VKSLVDMLLEDLVDIAAHLGSQIHKNILEHK